MLHCFVYTSSILPSENSATVSVPAEPPELLNNLVAAAEGEKC